MIAVVTVGIATATRRLLITADIVEEGRAARAAWGAESQQRRNAWEAESRHLRDEARADREAAERDREAFDREFLRLTQGEAERAAIVGSTRPKNE